MYVQNAKIVENVCTKIQKVYVQNAKIVENVCTKIQKVYVQNSKFTAIKLNLYK